MSDPKKMKAVRKAFDLWWNSYPFAGRSCRVTAFDAFAAALKIAGLLRDDSLGAAGEEEQDLVAAVLAGTPQEATSAANALADRVRQGLVAPRNTVTHYVVCISILGPYRHGDVVARSDLETVAPAPLIARLLDLGSIRPQVEPELVA